MLIAFALALGLAFALRLLVRGSSRVSVADAYDQQAQGYNESLRRIRRALMDRTQS